MPSTFKRDGTVIGMMGWMDGWDSPEPRGKARLEALERARGRGFREVEDLNQTQHRLSLEPLSL